MLDIVTYFTNITGFTPTNEQIQLLEFLVDPTVKNGIVSCGRGFSKTLCSAIAILWYAEKSLEDKIPVKLMIVSPQDTLYEYVNANFKSQCLIENLVKKGVYTQVPVEGYELKNGTKVFTSKATGKVRSNRADILFLDEAADIPEDVIKSAMQCLYGDINRIILISTPHAKGYFTDRASDPKKYGYTMKQFSSESCHWMTQTVARAKRELSKAEYAIEILGRPPSKAERTFFPKKNIMKCIRDNVLREGTDKSKVEIGIDFGYENTSIVVVEKLASRCNVLEIKQWKEKAIETIAPEIGEIIKKYKPCTVKADSLPVSYKGKVELYSTTKIHYVECAYCKGELLAQLQRRLLTNQIAIPESMVDLTKQLIVYRRGMSRGDDLVDTLCLAIYEPATPFTDKGNTKVFISRMTP